MIEVRRVNGPCHLVRDPVPGLRHLGIPRGGPADRLACAVANALAGNPGSDWCLEFALVAPVLVARATVGCAYSGPPVDLWLETGEGTRPVRVPGSFTWPAGAILRGGAFQRGIRGYLAISGGWIPPAPCLGAMFKVAGGMVPGALEGALRPRHLGALPGWTAPAENIRILPGSDCTEPVARSLGETWAVAGESDRMGIRLVGRPIPGPTVADRLSEPVVPGTVQLPGAGLPIVLGVDGQTIGGYPRVAHVIDADMDMLGQVRPGDRMAMRLVSLDEACNLGQERSRTTRDLVLGITAAGGW